MQAFNMHKDGEESYKLLLGWGFQDLIDSDTHFCSIQSCGVPNETLVSLIIDIFKLSARNRSVYQGVHLSKKTLLNRHRYRHLQMQGIDQF